MTCKSAATPVKEASRRAAEESIAASLTIVRFLVGWLACFFSSQGSLREKGSSMGGICGL